MTPRTEEVLSYMCGLAPVGEPFCVDYKAMATDMGNKTIGAYSAQVSKLIGLGKVRRIDCSLFAVVERPDRAERWWWQ